MGGRPAAASARAWVTTPTRCVRPPAPDIALGLKVSKAGRQVTPGVHARTISRWKGATWSESHPSPSSVQHPSAGHHHEEELHDIQTPPVLDGEHQWGMAIDLNTCIGCNACVRRLPEREQHPDRRQGGGRSGAARCTGSGSTAISRATRTSPELVHQPVACVQCENAPCEVVCPVNATVHGDEGLNVMVYSRCIGTRYCLNNCPYKVRRFNYLQLQRAAARSVVARPPGREGDGRDRSRCRRTPT